MTSERVRLLVVDDDPALVRLMHDCLKRDYDVLTALDGETAWEILETEQVAAVLADHMMPGVTGVDLLARVMNQFPDVVRILITASERVEDLKLAVNQARVHRFVQKPLRALELPRIVDSAIRETTLEAENRRLASELVQKNDLLTRALAKVQAHEKILEQEVEERTRELRLALAELEELALRDGLTGLYNHRFFQEALTTEVARSTRHQLNASLIFLDIDHFKTYNDLNGHPAGDALLKIFARILSDTGAMPELRFRGRTSDIAARYGGEEFVIILPETNKQGAMIRAERLRQTIEGFDFENAESQPLKRVTASIGVATFPDDGMSKQEIIAAADQAVYRAKRAGRNRVSVSGHDDAPVPGG